MAKSGARVSHGESLIKVPPRVHRLWWYVSILTAKRSCLLHRRARALHRHTSALQRQLIHLPIWLLERLQQTVPKDGEHLYRGTARTCVLPLFVAVRTSGSFPRHQQSESLLSLWRVCCVICNIHISMQKLCANSFNARVAPSIHAKQVPSIRKAIPTCHLRSFDGVFSTYSHNNSSDKQKSRHACAIDEMEKQ